MMAPTYEEERDFGTRCVSLIEEKKSKKAAHARDRRDRWRKSEPLSPAQFRALVSWIENFTEVTRC